jgi:hypothetical protein
MEPPEQPPLELPQVPEQPQAQMPPLRSPYQQPGELPPYQPYPYPPPYYPPPYYPPAYPFPPRSQTDTPLMALVFGLVGLLFWCPPFVLPSVTLYLVRKAREEMAAGILFGPSSESYLKVAKVLAIIAICLNAAVLLFYAFIFGGMLFFD